MHQSKVAIISKSTSAFIPLQKDLKENYMDVCAVSSIEDILEKYINLPYVLAIIDTNSFGENTLNLVSRMHGSKPAPVLVLMSESCPCNRLDLLRMGATVCMGADATPEEQAAQAKALIQVYNARDDSLHQETLVFGSTLVINPIYRLVILNGERIDLSRREFGLLYLMANITSMSLLRISYTNNYGTTVKILRSETLSNLALKYCEENWSQPVASTSRM